MRKKGRQEGKREARNAGGKKEWKEVPQEGRKKGRKGEGTEGRKEVRKHGRKEGRNAGKKNDMMNRSRQMRGRA